LRRGAALFRLADPSAHEIEVTVIEEDLPLVQVGQAVDVYFDDIQVNGKPTITSIPLTGAIEDELYQYNPT